MRMRAYPTAPNSASFDLVSLSFKVLFSQFVTFFVAQIVIGRLFVLPVICTYQQKEQSRRWNSPSPPAAARKLCKNVSM
jgi:hypothetical protein